MEIFYTIDELAQMLKIGAEDVARLIHQKEIRALYIGKHVRVRDADLSEYLDRCAQPPLKKSGQVCHETTAADQEDAEPSTRTCATFAGRATFRYSGTVEQGVRIWVGAGRYGLRFRGGDFQAMLKKFRGSEVPVGLSFDRPEKGSVGAWVKENVTQMGLTCYIAGILIAEGYAQRVARGRIRFFKGRRDMARSA